MKRSKWTRETITNVLKTCTSVKDFRRRYSGAFEIMKRNHWDDLKSVLPTYQNIPAIQPFIETSKQNPQPWTKERIEAVIKTCTSGKDFRRNHCCAYDAMKRNGWKDLLDLLPTHQPGYIHPASRLVYTKDYLRDLISRCKSQFEFRNQYRSAYSKLHKRGWDDLLSGLPYYPRREDEQPIWCIYKWTFIETGAVYIGLTSNYNRRISEEYKNRDTSPVKRYLDDTGCTFKIEKLKTGLYSHEAADYERKCIEEHRNAGYTVINRHPGGSLGGYVGERRVDPRSDDEILNEIFSKFSTYSDLRKHGKRLYTIVSQRNLYEQVWSRLPKFSSTVKYSIDYLASIIRKCTTFIEFKTLYPKEYKYMSRRGLCHMLNRLDRSVKPELPDGFDEVIALVNEGTLTKRSAASRLGITTNRLTRLGKGLLKPVEEISALRRAETSRQKSVEKAETKQRKKAAKQSELLETVERKYTTLAELRADQNLYSQIKRYGLYKAVSATLEHKRRSEVTRSDVEQAISKCGTYAQFLKEYPSEYGTAHRNHWDDLLERLPRSYTKADDITVDRIKDCIRQCKSRTEFNKKFRTESYTAKKRGIYDELVKDMPKQSGRSNDPTTFLVESA